MGANNKYMIGIDEAIELVNSTVSTNHKTQTISLENGLDYFLAKDVVSPINMPPFNQSAMDGYALLFDQDHIQHFTLRDEIKAGDDKKISLKTGEAVRIFTGAPTPINANAVIMQEKTSVKNGILTIDDELINGKNIRPIGEQILQDQIALTKGNKLNAAAIGYLATLGITEAIVYQQPNICIVVTGNELISPGEKLAFGQIYESNAIMLKMALAKLGFNKITITKVRDNYKDTKEQLAKSIIDNDFVLISGGISVGDYDFVEEALKEIGIEQVFYKIRQKPGKPLFFGKNEDTYVFALPGNPASALTCFYMYIRAALQQFVGDAHFSLSYEAKKLTEAYSKKGTRGEFLKANIEGGNVSVLRNQSSAMLNTFALSNALVYIPEEVNHIQKGEEVFVYRIDV